MDNMKNVPKKIEIMVVFGILMSHTHTCTSLSNIDFNLIQKTLCPFSGESIFRLN